VHQYMKHDDWRPPLRAPFGNAAARHWLHPRCSLFWNVSSPRARHNLSASRLQLPLTMSREDLCTTGRHVVYPWHAASEVVLIPALQLGYIVVRKCGSTTVLRAIEAAFDSDQYHCGAAAAASHCSTFRMPDTRGYRCSTACLDERTVSNY
jgi:hypothetical protein